eukprot:UN21008
MFGWLTLCCNSLLYSSIKRFLFSIVQLSFCSFKRSAAFLFSFTILFWIASK